MKDNNATVLVDWDAAEQPAAADPLTLAYADLGKAFYDYRFEEPTPELLLFFDRITELKQGEAAAARREGHMEPMAKESFAETILTSNPNGQPSVPTPEPEPASSDLIMSLDAIPDLTETTTRTAEPAAQPRFCPNCGTPFSPDDVFCGGCGYKLR